LILRPEAPLFFANAELVIGEVRDLLRRARILDASFDVQCYWSVADVVGAAQKLRLMLSLSIKWQSETTRPARR
jgi:hypothetical protein